MNLYIYFTEKRSEMRVMEDSIGIDLDQLQDMIPYAKDLCRDKPVRVIEDWVWVDILGDKKELDASIVDSLQPAFIYSSNVIADETRYVPYGGYIRTTPLKRFSENCIFETRNTSYILVGSGKSLAIPLNEAKYVYSLR